MDKCRKHAADEDPKVVSTLSSSSILEKIYRADPEPFSGNLDSVEGRVESLGPAGEKDDARREKTGQVNLMTSELGEDVETADDDLE